MLSPFISYPKPLAVRPLPAQRFNCLSACLPLQSTDQSLQLKTVACPSSSLIQASLALANPPNRGHAATSRRGANATFYGRRG